LIELNGLYMLTKLLFWSLFTLVVDCVFFVNWLIISYWIWFGNESLFKRERETDESEEERVEVRERREKIYKYISKQGI